MTDSLGDVGLFARYEKIATKAPSRSARWTYRSNTDGLVHRVLAGYRTIYYKGLPCIGITECGQPVSMRALVDDLPIGEYVSDDVVVNCIRCALGTCVDGEAMRQLQKKVAFSETYGGVAEKVLANYPAADVSAVLRLSQDMKQALFPPKKRLR